MKESGILMPLFSLPSTSGIGDMGKETLEFIDILSQNGVSIWQILPLNPAGCGNSPYQPYSSFAGDPIYINLDSLKSEGLIKSDIPIISNKSKVNYEEVRSFKEKYLKEAFSNFKFGSDFEEFAKIKWVKDYAEYISIKKHSDNLCWTKWQNDFKIYRENFDFPEEIKKEIEYECFLQYEFNRQWEKIKAYANKKNIRIMGDVPFYVGLDSSDVWSQSENFLLDSDGYPSFVAGVPPDYFSSVGQRWGNPIYDWDFMKEDGYSFWISRIKRSAELFDIIRIDHFRAFDTYWSIPSSCPTAIDGEWIEAPGYEVIQKLKEKNPNTELVAEDLGEIRPEVTILKDHFSLKGMKVLMFAINLDKKTAFDSFKDKENLIVYTGTHDNATVEEWYKNLSTAKRRKLRKFFKKKRIYGESISDKMIVYALKSDAKYAIISMPDLLSLGRVGHINTPGTVGSPNWEYRETDFERIILKAKKYKKLFQSRN